LGHVKNRYDKLPKRKTYWKIFIAGVELNKVYRTENGAKWFIYHKVKGELMHHYTEVELDVYLDYAYASELIKILPFEVSYEG
jgi:hypothetical protein